MFTDRHHDKTAETSKASQVVKVTCRIMHRPGAAKLIRQRSNTESIHFTFEDHHRIL